MNRRDMLKETVVGTAGAFLGLAATPNKGAAQETAPHGIGHDLGRILEKQLRVDAGNDLALAHDEYPSVR